MAQSASSGSPLSGATSILDLRRSLQIGLALIILVGLLFAANHLYHDKARGAEPAFLLLIGGAFGFVVERGRFCFYCIFADLIDKRDSTGMYSVLTALAVGGIGYTIIFGIFTPNSMLGRLPPNAHIGPVSWVLALAGLAFGLGMALSGACISGHLYRLGEGYSRAPFALIGSLIGFGLGFKTWYELYVGAIARAPITWLPAEFGYGGALIIHLLVLGGLALLLFRFLPEQAPREGGKLTYAGLYQSIFVQRWNPLATGAIVGIIGVFSYLRSGPLGVTSQLGSISRTVLTDQGYIGDTLPGLDSFTGCATQVVRTITDNGLLVSGFVLGSFGAALLANRFKLSRLTPVNTITALLGGVLMGWGSMTALGCTVGTLLSGISAFALSGWVFGVAVFLGVTLGIKLKLTS